MGIPLLAGRDLSAADNAGSARVAVVNDRFLRRYYGDVNPVGRTFTFRGAQQQFEIIGVVGDAKFFRLRNESPPTIFLSYLQTSTAGPGLERMFLAIRTGSAANVMRAVTRELRSIREDIPVHDMRSQEAQLDSVLIRERLLAALSAFFGVFALLLASIGLYGVMSYSVARRTNEIGVRIALGAQRGEVLSLVMREKLWIVAIGMVVGAVASLVLNRFVASILFDLAPNDPTTTVVAIALMSTIAGIAGYLPAHRASRVDPTVALRHE